jgi:hypothetical protein
MAPDETEHLWRGLLSEDVHARVLMEILHTQLAQHSCSAVAWLVLVTVTILVRREVK